MLLKKQTNSCKDRSKLTEPKKIIITGGCGFVGHHVVEHFLKTTDWDIVTFDKLTYAANGLNRIRDIDCFSNNRVTFFALDFTREISMGVRQECGDADYILHLGAETHVDNSINDPAAFVYANVVGTLHILEFARKCINLKAFVYFSTDEVFGPAPIGKNYKEWDRYNSTNPYAATKAGAEELVLSYMSTYGLKGFITHCMNILGERQHPEKFVPLCIDRIRRGKKIYIHASPDKKTSGSRFYIHARNVAIAVHYLLGRFEQREKYNIVGEREYSNLELAQFIASCLGEKLKYEMVDFHHSRPGHDLRYALDGSRLEAMGWNVPVTIERCIFKTVRWSIKNPQWIGAAKQECF